MHPQYFTRKGDHLMSGKRISSTIEGYGCIGLAVALVSIGTISTGFLPEDAIYQIIAGGLIVAGFALGYFCFESPSFFPPDEHNGGTERTEEPEK
jgi:hypothetical protein